MTTIKIYLPNIKESFIVDEGEEKAIEIQQGILENNQLAWIIYIN